MPHFAAAANRGSPYLIRPDKNGNKGIFHDPLHRGQAIGIVGEIFVPGVNCLIRLLLPQLQPGTRRHHPRHEAAGHGAPNVSDCVFFNFRWSLLIIL